MVILSRFELIAFLVMKVICLVSHICLHMAQQQLNIFEILFNLKERCKSYRSELIFDLLFTFYDKNRFFFGQLDQFTHTFL